MCVCVFWLPAEDHVGRRVAESSEGFVVDSSPPVMTSANFRIAQPYFTSASSISLWYVCSAWCRVRSKHTEG